MARIMGPKELHLMAMRESGSVKKPEPAELRAKVNAVPVKSAKRKKAKRGKK